MKAMTLSVAHLENTLNRLETEKSFLMKNNKVLVYCSSKTTTSGGRNTERLLNHIPAAYQILATNVEKAVLRYGSRRVSEQLQFISELRRELQCKAEEAEEMSSCREDGTMSATTFLLLTTQNVIAVYTVSWQCRSMAGGNIEICGL